MKPIIFCDFDGCIASHGKIWHGKFQPALADPMSGRNLVEQGERLTVSKVISDHDSWAIDYFKEYAHIVIISGDNRINEAWAKRRGVPFIYTCPKGFHQDKWPFLLNYIQNRENFDDAGTVEEWQSQESENDFYPDFYYIGDAMPDYNCMVNAKRAYVPKDASTMLIAKLAKSEAKFKILNTSSGEGVFEEICHRLTITGELPSV